MATRPAWTVINNKVVRLNYDFVFNPGFSKSQKQKNVEALHASIGKKSLEVSTKSFDNLGIKLSAFNLKLHGIPLECVYQSSKKYENGGPYTDLMFVSPKDAKRDERHKNSGKMISFSYNGIEFPLEPKTIFYDYIYISAVREQFSTEEIKGIMEFEFFTDIEFNPQKSINCQAKSVALIKVMLNMFGEIPNLDSFDEFKKFYKFIQADKS
jgi:hypothetical protein